MHYSRLVEASSEYIIYATIEVREQSGNLIKTLKEVEIDRTYVPESESISSLAPEVYEAVFGSKSGDYRVDPDGSDFSLRQRDEDYSGELYLDLPNGGTIHADIIARIDPYHGNDLGGDGWDD